MLDVSSAQKNRDLGATVFDMVATLGHRGPDASGVWSDDEVAFSVGHSRLSIIDLSETGAQPMRSRNGRFVIAYNGEVYNHPALRSELKREGVVFRGSSDTEVLVEACACWGIERTLGRVSGMFAIAVWDAWEKILWLVRDRFGKKPLYYGWIGGCFGFASELKAFRAIPSFAPKVDARAARLYGALGYVPGGYSIFEGIHKLCAGQFLRVPASTKRQCSLNAIRYWGAIEGISEGVTKRRSTDDESAMRVVHERLSEAVRQRMVADVPLGALLSGGVDSSLVVALMQQHSNRPVKTFTVGFTESQYDEARFARRVADHLGTEHTEVLLTPQETMAVIPRLPQLYDEPFADSSQIPTFLISSIARQSVTVALSGDGGDEIFGGYTRYLTGMKLWLALGSAPKPLRSALAKALVAFSPSALDRIFRVLSPALPGSMRQRRPGVLLHKLARVLSNTDLATFYGQLTTLGDRFEDPQVVETVLAMLPPPMGNGSFDPRDWLMAADISLYLPDDILTKVDRASMGVSLEVRSPLLDCDLFDAAWCLPLSMKFRDGVGKWCLRRMLEDHLPAALLARPKSGFAVPIAEWLRGPLREWAESLISRERLADTGIETSLGVSASIPVRAIWAEHLSGRRNREHELWSILMYQAWHDAWIR